MIPLRPRGGASPQPGRQAVREAPTSRVVPKPVPQKEARDPRTYQIEQLRRRFSPRESTLENGDLSLSFDLSPSDPDFPYDLDQLHIQLHVPENYPKAPPALVVKNSDIPRGFAINIERGWDRLVKEKRGATLLALANALDRQLESFLSEQKAETVKLVTFKRDKSEPKIDIEKTSVSEPPTRPRPYIPRDYFTKDQVAEAKARRAQEVRQLEARMNRLPLYQKSNDGIIYTLPLEPKRRAQLPVGLQAVSSVQLIIPLLYPLQPLRILLNGVESKDAEDLEELFSRKATDQKDMSLTSHINYLATNMHVLAKQAQKLVTATPSVDVTDEVAKPEEAVVPLETGDAKAHIHVIPRPPEWGYGDHSSGSDSDSDESSEEGVEHDEDLGETSGTASLPSRTIERGTAITFPSVELYHVDLLQISLLGLSVKCDRCKTINDITNIEPNKLKSSSCKKCATPFALTFRPELVHQNSVRAGFVDAAGCTISDLLLSTFVPTCECSTPYQQGLVSVRGDATTNVCRECHARFTFKLPDVKFLVYASSGMPALAATTGPRRRQEKLGLHAGEPLPDRGACGHYRKSHRWFRFSCCSKVYPCDKCHDMAEDHINEWANRMICGFCSREQNYSVESCAFCGRSVIGRRGKGFWEGGKGTRDQRLMRRGDRRKYRRTGGGQQQKAKADE
ncbi:hypothetical protein OQA88_9065 [Cercophora sp. LCS_1]